MKILSWIVRYKFIIAILLFISYLSFSENSIFLNIRLKKEIKKLETENEFLSFQNEQMKIAKRTDARGQGCFGTL
jgi:hypothetical protein